jgi:nucleotide-binding universal stress UspA family protein
MFQRILVPLDGSERAEEAISTAAYLARNTGASLFLLRIVGPSATYVSPYPYGWDSSGLYRQVEVQAETEAHDYLSRLILTAHLDTIHHHIEVLNGLAVPRILQFVRENQIDLIVMRSHGETGFKRWLLGSVARGIVRHSPAPTLIIRDASMPTFTKLQELLHTIRILIPLDGSHFAESALLPAAQLSATFASPAQGAIHLMQTVHLISEKSDKHKDVIDKINKDTYTEAAAYLKNVKQRFSTGDLAQYHLQVTSSVVPHADRTEIWKRIIEEAEQAQVQSIHSPTLGDVTECASCDIISMATHGRHGLQHLLEGSITESVLDASSHPLLVVHTQTKEGEEEPTAETDHT